MEKNSFLQTILEQLDFYMQNNEFETLLPTVLKKKMIQNGSVTQNIWELKPCTS